MVSSGSVVDTAVFPVRAREFTFAVHNLGGHGGTRTVSVARIQHNSGVVYLILALKLLDSYERQLICAMMTAYGDHFSL